MNVFLMGKLEDDDNVDLRRLMEFVNQAAAFFEEPAKPDQGGFPRGKLLSISGPVERQTGRRTIERLASGNILAREDFDDALREIVKAQERLRKREPDQFFPKELKAQYKENLSEAEFIVQNWIDQLCGD